MSYQPIIYKKSDFKALKQIFNRSWKISFYKKLYQQLSSPKSLHSINDLIRLPIISRNLLAKHSFIRLNELPRQAHYLISARVNPKGDEVVYPLSINDFNQYIKFERYKFFYAGVKSSDRCAIVAFSQNATIPMSQAIMLLKASYIPLDGDEEVVFRDLIRYKVNVIFTVPQVLYRLIEYVKRCHYKTSLRLVITTGVHIHNLQQTQTQTKQILGAELVDTIGVTELASFAVSCRSQINNYHFINEQIIVEIINPENNLPATEGEIVITPLWKEDYPLIRYRTGDYIKLMKNNHCLCRFPSPWYFNGIIKRLDGTIRIERYMGSLAEIYNSAFNKMINQGLIDKLLWRICQPPLMILLLANINNKDTILIFIEKYKSIFTFRRTTRISNYVNSLSSADTKALYCDKKDLNRISPKYIDIRNAKSKYLSKPLKVLIAKYKDYFL